MVGNGYKPVLIQSTIKTIYNKQLNITIMERYDYLEAIKEDVLNYINENNIVVTSENRDEVEQDLNDSTRSTRQT